MNPIGKFPTLYILLALLSLSTLFAGLTADSFHSWGGDFSLYIQQAEAIIHRNSQQLYEENAYMMDHSETVLGPHLYPPGFPLMLAPVYAWVGLDLLALKWVGIVCFILSQGILYLYFRAYLSPPLLVALIACFSLNPWLIRYCDFIHSDIPFLLFCLLSLWRMRIFFLTMPSFRSALLLGAVMGFACLIRSVGILLIFTFFLWGFINRKGLASSQNKNPHFWLKAITVFLSSLSFLIISEFTYPSGTGSYLNYLQEYGVSNLLNNLWYYLTLLQIHLGWFSLPFYLLGIPLIVWGLKQNFEPYKLEFLFSVLYFGALIVWPFADGLRFIFPLLPFLTLFFLLGLHSFIQGISKRSSMSLSPIWWSSGIIALLFFGCIYNAFRDYPPKPDGKIGNAASKEVFHFIENNLPLEAPLYFFRPRILRLYTGKQSLAKKGPLTCDEERPFFLILPKSEEMIVCEKFNPLFTNQEFTILHAQEDI